MKSALALKSAVITIMIFSALFAGSAHADDAATNAANNETQMKTIGIIGGISWVSSIEY